MSDIVTDYAIDKHWYAYKSGQNTYTFTFTLSGSAFDISSYTFSVVIKKAGHSTAELTLTQGSGVTNGGSNGVLTISLTESQASTTLPRDFYHWEVRYVKDSLTYRMVEGNLYLSTEDNPGTASSSTASISLAGTNVSAAITLAGLTSAGITTALGYTAANAATLTSHLVDTDNPHEVTAELIRIGVNVDDYGALGDGSTDDTDAINDAIEAAGANGVLRFTPGKTYLLKDSIAFSGTQTIWGYGATVKRSAAIQTTTTASVADGATTIPVTDSSIFVVGDEVLITDATQANGGIAQSESSLNGTNRQVIASITGNTLTVTNSVQHPSNGSFPSGSKVFKCFDLISIPFNNQPFYIYGLTIDGNKANNQTNYSWLINTSIDKVPANSVIRDCTFINAPNENMFVEGNVIISNCFFRDSNSGAVHVTKVGDTDGAVILSSCIMDNVCIQGETITSHSEAVITCSNSTTNVILDNCQINDANEGFIIGTIGSLDDNIQISNCPLIKYAAGIIDYSAASNSRIIEGIKIFNNFFEDAGNIIITHTQTLQVGYGADKVLIADNVFKNSKLSISQTSNINISGNTFEFTNGGTVSSSGGSVTGAACILLRNCVDFNIDNNKFIDLNTTYNADIAVAIILDDVGTRDLIKSDASTDTDYIYGCRNVNIKGNTIWGFAYGIDDAPASTHAGTTQFIGVNISDNLVIMRDDANATTGIKACPGMTVNNNTIYANSGCDRSLWVLGVDSTKSSALNGPIVTNNKVYGGGKTIELHSTRNYNAQILNNILTAALSNSSANSNISGNVTMTVNQNAIPLHLPRENSGFY